ncbi:MAG TPA: hypothetical protein P5121_26125, partial [Caldilineaceae bacterium]|nr:hypothetical protein [Caldilineaceae bacterium]
WLKSKLLDEFNRIKLIKGQTGRGQQAMTAVAPRREAVANALAALPVNEWVTFSEFSRYMQAAGHTFTISRDLWTLYVEEAEYGSLGYQGFGEWHIVQARYLLVFLMEYAATLGLIDIAYIPPANARLDFTNLWGVDDFDALSDYDGLRYLRLNNLGAWILGVVDSYQPPEIEQRKVFNILPNHDIVTVGPLPASDRLLLERFAKQTADQVWQLDQALLLNAQEAGLPISDIRDFLAMKSHTGLPQTVEILLSEMIEKVAGLVSMEPAHLIEVRDSRTAQLLSMEHKLSKHCQLVGERHLVVPAKALNDFRRVLHGLGYALPPVVE